MTRLMRPFLAVVMILSFAVAFSDEVRDWTNSEGRTISAQLLAVSSDSLKLQLPNGREYEISLTELSESDVAYARRWQAEALLDPAFRALVATYRGEGRDVEILAELDFENESLSDVLPRWSVVQGHYEIVDGALHGRELAEDHHVATAGMDLALRHHALVSFELQLHEAANTIVTLNGKGRGHVARIVLSPSFIRVQSDNKSGRVAVDRKVKLKRDKVVRVLIELHDDTLSVTLPDEGDEPLSVTDEFIKYPIDNVCWAVAKGPAKIDKVVVARIADSGEQQH